MLEGKKVVLRPIEREDIELFLKWFNDQEITQNLLFNLPLTREKEEKRINEINLSSNKVVFVIEVKERDRNFRIPIGTCGIHNIDWIDRDATLGIAIGEKDFWRSGYGTEAVNLIVDYAFTVLNLNRISSSAIGFNKASLKLHQKMGFELEGKRIKAKFKKGRYYDEILFGLLKKDWKKRK